MTIPIHVLHIGKTGGTAVKAALWPLLGRANLVLHDHRTRLCDCPQDSLVFFVVRDPLERFVSGFNSRLRRGQPRYNFPWSTGETVAFRIFGTANALAEAIDSRNPARRLLARWAMGRIGHVRDRLSDWLEGVEEWVERRRLIIGTTATLEGDLQRLLATAQIDEQIILPRDPVAAHASPADVERGLSPRAVENLTRWYSDDIRLYETSLRIRSEALTGSN
ncbi:MAG: sulfotransferase family 2 domain-containing protein [Sphingosinicella sp.]